MTTTLLILAAALTAALVAAMFSNKSSLRRVAKSLFESREDTMGLHPAADGKACSARCSQVYEAACGLPMLQGNCIDILTDGPNTYRAMLDAIAMAEKHIHLESYVFEDGEVATEFVHLLTAKARQGVKVRVLYDALGSFDTSADLFSSLESGGVSLKSFQSSLDLRFWRFHQRDHRKLMVVDGRIGFIGGVNINDGYLNKRSSFNNTPDKPEDLGTHDVHTRVEGPVVTQLQSIFLSSWRNLGGRVEPDSGLFPTPAGHGTQQASIVAADRLDNGSRVMDAQIAAIETAVSSICVTNAYFIPHQAYAEALMKAAERGVKVRLILPSFSDHALTIYAAHAHYESLLASGIEVFEFQPKMLHSKTMVVDQLWSSIGSSNIDIRSLEHNSEANLVVIDASFAQAMQSKFDKDLTVCKRVELLTWQQRGRLVRLRERSALLFKYWL